MKRRRNDETTENTEADLGLEYWSVGAMSNRLRVAGFYILMLAGLHILDFRMRIAE